MSEAGNEDLLEARLSEVDEAITYGEFEAAASLLDALEDELGQDHADVLYQRAVLAWEREGPEAAVELLDSLLRREPEYADAHYARALICEEADDREGMLRHFESVRRLDALAFEESGGVAEGELDFIEAQAEAALDTVPERFRDLLSNVPVVLEERPNLELVRTGFDPRALGLFEGLEHAQQASELHTAPTRIVLYYGNLLATFHEQDDLADEIEVTLLHEIGHYFGLDEDEVERLGLA